MCVYCMCMSVLFSGRAYSFAHFVLDLLFIFIVLNSYASSLLQFHSDFNFFLLLFRFSFTSFLSIALLSFNYKNWTRNVSTISILWQSHKTHTYMHACWLVGMSECVCVYERYRLVFLMGVSVDVRARARARAGMFVFIYFCQRHFPFRWHNNIK